jgi:hypothetical protein
MLGANGALNVLVYNTSTFEITYTSNQGGPLKNFVIDHPVSPDKYLVHACLEGPEAGVYYKGESVIESDRCKFVEITLPSYVKHFATDFSIQLSPIGNENSLYTSRVDKETGKFKVFGKPGEFFWYVYGKRQSIEVEPLKTDVNVKGSGPYKWI